MGGNGGSSTSIACWTQTLHQGLCCALCIPHLILQLTQCTVCPVTQAKTQRHLHFFIFIPTSLILEFCLEISSGSFCVWLCPSLLTCHLRKETFLRTLASEHFFSFLPNTYHDLKLYVYFLLVSVTISLVIAANTALSPCAKWCQPCIRHSVYTLCINESSWGPNEIIISLPILLMRTLRLRKDETFILGAPAS